MISMSPVQAAVQSMAMAPQGQQNPADAAPQPVDMISEVAEVIEVLEVKAVLELLEMSSTALAARATYDSRAAQNHQEPASFDRMALVREGFEHTREIFAALSKPSQNELSGMLGQDMGDAGVEVAAASGGAEAGGGAAA